MDCDWMTRSAVLSTLLMAAAMFNAVLLPKEVLADSNCCGNSCTRNGQCTCECSDCGNVGSGGRACNYPP